MWTASVLPTQVTMMMNVQVHSRYDPTAHATELREEGATAKGIPQGFTKQSHYPDPHSSHATNGKLEQV